MAMQMLVSLFILIGSTSGFKTVYHRVYQEYNYDTYLLCEIDPGKTLVDWYARDTYPYKSPAHDFDGYLEMKWYNGKGKYNIENTVLSNGTTISKLTIKKFSRKDPRLFICMQDDGQYDVTYLLPYLELSVWNRDNSHAVLNYHPVTFYVNLTETYQSKTTRFRLSLYDPYATKGPKYHYVDNWQPGKRHEFSPKDRNFNVDKYGNLDFIYKEYENDHSGRYFGSDPEDFRTIRYSYCMFIPLEENGKPNKIPIKMWGDLVTQTAYAVETWKTKDGKFMEHCARASVQVRIIIPPKPYVSIVYEVINNKTENSWVYHFYCVYDLILPSYMKISLTYLSTAVSNRTGMYVHRMIKTHGFEIDSAVTVRCTGHNSRGTFSSVGYFYKDKNVINMKRHQNSLWYMKNNKRVHEYFTYQLNRYLGNQKKSN